MERPWKGEVFRAYEEGKHRRYNLLFAVNGGVFTVAKLFGDPEPPTRGTRCEAGAPSSLRLYGGNFPVFRAHVHPLHRIHVILQLSLHWVVS
jgi:hypothetical protein